MSPRCVHYYGPALCLLVPYTIKPAKAIRSEGSFKKMHLRSNLPPGCWLGRPGNGKRMHRVSGAAPPCLMRCSFLCGPYGPKQTRHISADLVRSRSISPISRPRSPDLVRSHPFQQISPDLARSCRISPDLATARQISPDFVRSCQISPDLVRSRLARYLARSRSISPQSRDHRDSHTRHSHSHK